MLSKEENEMLTRVGPGTPCGELMRRYWHPIAATVTAPTGSSFSSCTRRPTGSCIAENYQA